MRTYVGVDPGKTGCVALLRPSGIEFIDAEKLNIALLGDLLREELDVFVLLEKAQVMPRMRKNKITGEDEPAGQGAVGMLRYGQGYGEYVGMLKALRIPFDEVHPMSWKRIFSLIGQEKDAARAKAIQLFPGCAENLKLKKHIHRADAVLIAEFARRQNM